VRRSCRGAVSASPRCGAPSWRKRPAAAFFDAIVSLRIRARGWSRYREAVSRAADV
jgi:hypothetical protein